MGRLRLHFAVNLLAVSYLTLAPAVAHTADEREFRGCWGNFVELAEATSHPVNGHLLAYQFVGGCDGTPLEEMLTVEVDGEPATIAVTDPLRSFQDTQPIAIEPRPEVGQTVAIYEWGNVELATLEVGEADDEPPTVPTVALEADYGMTDLWDDYGRWMFMVNVVIVEPSVDDSAVRYDIELSADGELVDQIAVVARANPDVPDYRDIFPAAAATNPFHEATEICVDVRAIDAAGNPSNYTRECVDGVPFQTAPEGSADDGFPAPPPSLDCDADCDDTTCAVGDRNNSALLWLLPLLWLARRGATRRRR